MNIVILYLVRFIFLGLVFFELVNFFGVLNFELDFSWIGLALTSLFVWAAIEAIHYKFKKSVGKVLPSIVLIAPTFSVLIDALGDILRFYSSYSWYDQLAHFVGGMSAAGFVYFVIKIYISEKNINLGKKFIGVISVFGTAFLASFYEIEEYAETLFLHNNRLGDRMDTPNDLFLTVFGGFLGALLIMIYLKIKKR